KIQRQPLRRTPVIGKIEAYLAAPLSRPVLGVVVRDQSWESQQKARHGIAASACGLPRIGQRGREIEPPVALIGLIDGQLPATEIDAPLQCVRAGCKTYIVDVFECVFAPVNRQRTRLPDADIA